LRALFIVFCAAIGAIASSELRASMWPGVLLGLLLGLVVVLIDRLLKGFSLRAFSSATFGLLLGWLFARLLVASQIFAYLSATTQWAIGLVVYCTFGYLGMMLAMRSNRDEFSLIIPYVRFAREATQHQPLVVDTNVIIDGRVADLCETGFLEGTFILPQFILNELQHIADSADPLKRSRGRRGLDILNKIQKMVDVEVRIVDEDFPHVKEVDSKIVVLAKKMNAKVITNDLNLSKVAELQGVRVLNINELCNALKPVVLPGEQLRVFVLKEGKEAAQGVAYLDDGTMIVVDNAKRFIGSNVNVVVTSVLQTQAGRMIFTRLKEETEGQEQAVARG
jgi:uncharacterized protein YacL